MAYRLTINGVVIECDTPEEAFGLSAMRSPLLPLYDRSRDNESPPPSLTMHQMSAREPRVSNRVKEFLSALKEAYPDPLTSDALADRLNTSAKGIPAVVVGIRVLFGKWGVQFDDMINYEKRVDGETTMGQYRLTANGLRVLHEQTSEKET